LIQGSKYKNKLERRKFLKTSSAIIGGASVLTGLYTWQIEPFWLEFVHRKMKIKNLPEGLVGKRLMQISDVHVGNRFDWNYIIDSFKKAQRYQPDLVVYTGDFTHFKTDEQYSQLKTVFKHAVTGSMGTFGCLGNHDYGPLWLDLNVANNLSEILSEAGIKMLRNEMANIQGLNIIGLEDYWSPNFAPEQVLKTISNKEANLVLCHNPDVMDEPVWSGYNSWVLSGHTHGGQCKPPFLKAPRLPVKNKRYSAGEFDFEDGRTLYINRALGHLWQIRFNVRPEITIFELGTV